MLAGFCFNAVLQMMHQIIIKQHARSTHSRVDLYALSCKWCWSINFSNYVSSLKPTTRSNWCTNYPSKLSYLSIACSVFCIRTNSYNWWSFSWIFTWQLSMSLCMVWNISCKWLVNMAFTITCTFGVRRATGCLHFILSPLSHMPESPNIWSSISRINLTTCYAVNILGWLILDLLYIKN